MLQMMKVRLRDIRNFVKVKVRDRAGMQNLVLFQSTALSAFHYAHGAHMYTQMHTYTEGKRMFSQYHAASFDLELNAKLYGCRNELDATPACHVLVGETDK